MYRNMKSIFTILGICQWSKITWAARRKVFFRRLINNFRRVFPFVPFGNRPLTPCHPPPPHHFCTGKNARVAERLPTAGTEGDIVTTERKKKGKEKRQQTNKTKNLRNEFPFYIRLNVTKSINVVIFKSKPDGFRVPTKAIKCHTLPRSIWLLSSVQPGTDFSYPKIWLLSEATSLRGIKGACPRIW